mmetsp:Transcript_5249/g.11800  ORF Transcript_5249/g.11800 Transcript_5249/m.11800 type:complete len:299 (-) Transcript_5249:72-968(-)
MLELFEHCPVVALPVVPHKVSRMDQNVTIGYVRHVAVVVVCIAHVHESYSRLALWQHHAHHGVGPLGLLKCDDLPRQTMVHPHARRIRVLHTSQRRIDHGRVGEGRGVERLLLTRRPPRARLHAIITLATSNDRCEVSHDGHSHPRYVVEEWRRRWRRSLNFTFTRGVSVGTGAHVQIGVEIDAFVLFGPALSQKRRVRTDPRAPVGLLKPGLVHRTTRTDNWGSRRTCLCRGLFPALGLCGAKQSSKVRERPWLSRGAAVRVAEVASTALGVPGVMLHPARWLGVVRRMWRLGHWCH